MPQVSVTVDPSQPAGQQCAPDPAFAVTGQPTTFVFRLASPSQWQWHGTSPVTVQNGGDQFPDPSHVQPSDGAVVLHDRNTDTNRYKYTVTAINKNTGQPVLIDPIIQNQ